MIMKKTLFFTALYFTLWQAHAQLTPRRPLDLRPQTVEVPAAFKQAMPGTYTVNLPKGYRASVFYAGNLNKPRFMSFDGNGVLHVADYNAGIVYAMPDVNHDGIADTILVAASGFTGNHDVKFYNGNMYVTEARKVWKLTDANQDGVYEQRSVFIDNIGGNAPQPDGGHATRTLAFDSINGKVYLSIGSRCNACREEYRAVIEQYNTDGTGGRVFASGIRNAVGLTFHPTTNKLWANNNGSDNQGNGIPPEWIDLVRENGFYGYPFAYGNKTWLDFNAAPDYQALLPITATDSAKVNKMVLPAAHVEAHSAPMALTFLNGSFPASLNNGLISAMHGSWNAPGDHRGYNLTYVDFTDEFDTTANFTADFCTGFITDTVNRVYWARPVGLAITEKGELFMSSDESTRFILRIYPENPVGLRRFDNELHVLLYPNPSSGEIRVKLASQQQADITLYNTQGANVHAPVSFNNAASEGVINTRGLVPGIYRCVIVQDGKIATRNVLINP